MTRFIVAVAQYRIDFLADWDHFERKLRKEVDRAVATGAKLLVFPEYGSMELASLFPEEVYRSLPGQLEALQEVAEDYRRLYAELARTHAVYILAGSFPVRVAEARYHNRAWLASPEGKTDFQDKIVMTRFENERWGISGASELKLFDTGLGRLAVNICYDVEFPLLARAQVEAGADLLLVPSCTDTEAGYYRVRRSAQARAIENQCYAVHASTVGEAPWSEAVDVNIGAGAVYTPCDYGFPSNGVLAIGQREAPVWVTAEVDVGQARALRDTGQVFNHRNWPEQMRALGTAPRKVIL